jgi:hypothetical protein
LGPAQRCCCGKESAAKTVALDQFQSGVFPMSKILKLLGAVLVYLLGGAVFVFITYSVLRLIGASTHFSAWLALPLGGIAFGIFIWWNWDSHFENWGGEC